VAPVWNGDSRTYPVSTLQWPRARARTTVAATVIQDAGVMTTFPSASTRGASSRGSHRSARIPHEKVIVQTEQDEPVGEPARGINRGVWVPQSSEASILRAPFWKPHQACTRHSRGSVRTVYKKSPGIRYDSTMGSTVKKTGHAGAKHGDGAAWAPKKVAKKESSRMRRKNARRENPRRDFRSRAVKIDKCGSRGSRAIAA